MELSNTEPNIDFIAKFYADVVRISNRVSDKIHIMMNDEKCFYRPFVFAGTRYDKPELFMFDQLVALRRKIIENHPLLEQAI